MCFEITSSALYPLQQLEKAKQSSLHRYVVAGGAPPPEKNIEEHLLEIRLCFEITSPALYPLQRLEKAKQSLVHRYVGTGN